MNVKQDSRSVYRWPRRQAGDTIVEVIIAVAVVATILAGAFTVTTRSTQAVRDSEEHAEALQQLQGQVERLRAVAAKPGVLTGSPFVTSGFCLQPDLSITQAGQPTCRVNGLYDLSIKATSVISAAGTTDFDLVASWPAIGGGNATVFLSYKVTVS